MKTRQPISSLPSPERTASVDVFRGLTMLLMLFVNDIGDVDLGHIQNAPMWLKHIPGTVDGMTVADVIFPCFLFIIGLSVPLALERRVNAGESALNISRHIVTRALAMIFIGLCMVNSCHGYVPFEHSAMAISAVWWRVFMLAGVIAFWCRPPQKWAAKRGGLVALRLAAAALLAYLLTIYRVPSDGSAIWLRPRWWGIIGLCGWAYGVAAFVWLVCRNRATGLLGMFALFIALNIGLRFGVFGGWERLVQATHGWLPSLRLCANASMVIAGLAVATLYTPFSAVTTIRYTLGGTLLFGAGFAVAGLLLHHPWGIHKNGGTPAWILFSMAIACAVYTLIYWLVDVKKCTRWATPIAQAGSNTLLMYLLPYLFYSALSLLGIDFLKTHLSEGWTGVARSAAVALCLMGTTILLTRQGCRLKL